MASRDMKTYNNENTGALFYKDVEEGSKRPNFSGKVELDKTLVKELIDALAKGNKAELNIAGWSRTSSKGNNFISLRVSGASAFNKGGNSFKQKSSSSDDMDF